MGEKAKNYFACLNKRHPQKGNDIKHTQRLEASADAAEKSRKKNVPSYRFLSYLNQGGEKTNLPAAYQN